MKWSWKLGRFLGVDVYVHATFLRLLGWIALNAGSAPSFHSVAEVSRRFAEEFE